MDFWLAKIEVVQKVANWRLLSCQLATLIKICCILAGQIYNMKYNLKVFNTLLKVETVFLHIAITRPFVYPVLAAGQVS